MRPKPPPYEPDTELLEEHPHLKDILPFLHELRHESDRGAVLISCSYLEELLREILRSFLLDKAETENLLEGFNAPLGTFSARATAAFCCGLITQEEFKEITTLRRIRNEFAHSKTASFELQAIKDLCKNLKYAVPDYVDEKIDPFSQFTSSVVGLIANMMNRPHYVRKDRITVKSWPL